MVELSSVLEHVLPPDNASTHILNLAGKVAVSQVAWLLLLGELLDLRLPAQPPQYLQFLQQGRTEVSDIAF